MSKRPTIVPAQAVEVIIPEAILKLRDKFQKLGYRTTFGQYYVSPSAHRVVDTEFLSDMPAVYHVHGGTIVFQPLIEGISEATLFHPLSAAPVIMHFYTETGEFRSACMCGQLEGVESIPATSFEDVFADFPADYALWGEEEKQKELLTARRPKTEFKLVEKPITREEIFAQWQAQQEALQAAANEEVLDENDPGYVSGEAAAIDGAILHEAEKVEVAQRPYHKNFDIETKTLDDKNWEASFKLRDGEQEYKATASAAIPDSDDPLEPHEVEKLHSAELPTYDEDNEDAELGKIVDEREGQKRIRVDIETL